MYVADIIDEAVEITGLCKGPTLYRWISRCIEVLSNKANWDALQLYLDIGVQPEKVVILPREVMTPLKININKHPAFSRNRLYEFSLNGPGNDSGGLIGWQWMDQNTTPILVELPANGIGLRVQGDPTDNGAKIRFYGLDRNQKEVSDVITLDGTEQFLATDYAVMRRVRKDLTSKKVSLIDSDHNPVAEYYADEIDPRYRKIKLSKKATVVHMLFRRRTYKVYSDDDYIPLDSEMAIMCQLRAHSIARKTGQSAESENWEKKAVQYLQEEQASRNSFDVLAQQDEIQPAYNLNTNNRDSVIVADVYDDASEIFGQIGPEKLFDRITDGLEILNHKNPAWRGAEGYIDLNVGAGGIVTLPRYVDKPIKINMGRRPLEMRNRWFEFHLNGPGSECGEPCDKYDDIGESVTVNDPTGPFRLVAINDLEVDDGATVHVFGFDQNGKRVRTPNPDLDSDKKYIDGAIYSAATANTIPDSASPIWSRIDRITRDETNGFQQLLAYEDCSGDPTLIGYYYPDETEPNYSRIRLPCHCPWIRMRYRKRHLKVTSLTDPLHLHSRSAVVEMMRALKTRKDDPQKAEVYELKAKELLKEEQSATNPAETFTFEVDRYTDMADPLQGQF